MNVTFRPHAGQAPGLCRTYTIVIRALATGFLWLFIVVNNARSETHWNLQAVDSAGLSSWGGSYPITVVGVLLTDPQEMLDSAPNFIPYSGPGDLFKMGGEWQGGV